MDTFELRSRDDLLWTGWPEPKCLRIYINGEDLADLLIPVERTLAIAAGRSEDLAGSYGGLLPSLVSNLHPDLLGRDIGAMWRMREGTALAQVCTCGEPGCWPLLVHIDMTEHDITWRDFDGPLSDQVYEGIGPFRFAREEYLAQLRQTG